MAWKLSDQRKRKMIADSELAIQVRQLVDNPAVVDFLNKSESTAIEAMIQSDDPEERDDFRRKVQLIRGFKQYMITVLQDAQRISKELVKWGNDGK